MAMTPQTHYQWDKRFMEPSEYPDIVKKDGERPMTPEDDYEKVSNLRRCGVKWW